MAKLTGQTIADSYDQLLIVDAASGISASLQAIEAGDTGGSASSLKISTSKCEIIPASNSTSLFEVSQADGTAVLSVDTTYVRVGINESSPDEMLHLTSSTSWKPAIKLENTNTDSTGAYLEFHKTTTNEAAGDYLGIISFTGVDAGDAVERYAYISAQATTVTAGSEDGQIDFMTNKSGTETTAMTMKGGLVGIGIISPTTQLDIVNVTTSNTDQGAVLRLGCDDGAVMVDTHRLGAIEFTGAEDTNNNMAVGARIEAVAMETWNDLNNGATLDFYTTPADNNPTQRMTILANGDVGIGIAAPRALIHIQSAAETTDDPSTDADELCIEGSSTAGMTIFSDQAQAGNIYFGSNGRTSYGRIKYGQQSLSGLSDAMSFWTENTEKMRISSAGLVGIGTTTPDHMLNISKDAAACVLSIDAFDNHATNYPPSIYLRKADGTEGSPGLVAAADVLGEIAFYGHGGSSHHEAAKIFVKAGSPGTGNNDMPGSIYFSTTGDGGTSADDRMVIDYAGNVGIGTTSPISALEIEAGLTTVGAVLTLGTKEPTVVANDVLGRINFYAPLDTGTDSDEIGASIAAVAQATFSDTVNSTSLYFQTGKSEDATGTTASMVIDEDGYVGIGTTSPNTPLDVESNILDEALMARFTDTTMDDGDFMSIGFGKDPAANYQYGLLQYQYDSGNGSQDSFVGLGLHNSNFVLSVTGHGKVGIGTTAPTDLIHIKKTGMTDETSVVLTVDGTSSGGERRYAGFGVRYNSGASTDAPCAYIRMDTPDDSASYFWVDNGDRLMGSTTVTNVGTTSGVVQGAAATSSDERNKIISSNGFSYGLDKVNALIPMEFYYKDDVDKINRLGFGAQTTKPIIPEVVNDSKQCIDGYKWSYNEDGSEKEQVPNSDDTDGKLYMDYLQIIPVLVKAIQELSAKVTALENA